MTTFFLDLWQDLREKRLWPVAVGLLAAAVAIPAIMLKPAAEPSAPPVVAANSDHGEALPAVDVDTSPTHDSKLQTFDERNPFKPLKDLEREPNTGAAQDGHGGQTPSGGPAPGGDGFSGGGGGDIGTPPGVGPGGPTGGGGGDVPTTSSPTPTSDGSGGIRWFKFTADVEFGKSGDDAKLMKNVEPLTLLPKGDSPVLVFMGVTADAKGAQFFVADPSFSGEGEGKCLDRGRCQFITLRLDEDRNEETFTSTDGSVAYDLKLVKLRREEVSEAEARGDTVDSPNGKPAAHKSGGETISDASGGFLPRLLVGPGATVDDLK